MKNRLKKIRAYCTVRRIAVGTLLILGLGGWYAFGFLSVGPSSNSKENYAVKRGQIKKLPVDPNTPYSVVRVIDGDTFIAKINGENVSVRVLGMDAPETVNPKKPVQCYGPEASEEDKSLLNGHSVRLEIDPAEDKADFYGRLLAYVHRDDGLFLEDYMVKNGFAREYTFDPKRPYKYQKQFQADQAEAQAAKAGLWGKCNGVINK